MLVFWCAPSIWKTCLYFVFPARPARLCPLPTLPFMAEKVFSTSSASNSRNRAPQSAAALRQFPSCTSDMLSSRWFFTFSRSLRKFLFAKLCCITEDKSWLGLQRPRSNSACDSRLVSFFRNPNSTLRSIESGIGVMFWWNWFWSLYYTLCWRIGPCFVVEQGRREGVFQGDAHFRPQASIQSVRISLHFLTTSLGPCRPGLLLPCIWN